MLIFVAIAVASFIIVAGSMIFHHDHDIDHGVDVGDHTISVFSVKTMGTLTMGFGAAGAIAYHYRAGYLGSSLIGLGCGLVLGAAMYSILSLFVRQQSDSLVSTDSLRGSMGLVTAAIESGALGEVSVSANGQYSTFLAKSSDGKAIAKGQSVRVVQTIGSELIVEPVQG